MVVTDGEVEATHRVGKFEFVIRRAEDTPEIRRKWEGRIDALTALLLAAWRREHGEEQN
jgi:hypothetical protein